MKHDNDGEILNILSSLQKQLHNLDKRFLNIESKLLDNSKNLHDLIDRVETLESRLETNADELKKLGVVGFISKASKKQEEESRYYAQIAYTLGSPTLATVPIHMIGKWPTRNGLDVKGRPAKEVTDIDGAFVLMIRGLGVKAANDRLSNRISMLKSTESVTKEPINMSHVYSDAVLVVVEAKNDLNIHKVLHKMKQLYTYVWRDVKDIQEFGSPKLVPGTLQSWKDIMLSAGFEKHKFSGIALVFAANNLQDKTSTFIEKVHNGTFLDFEMSANDPTKPIGQIEFEKSIKHLGKPSTLPKFKDVFPYLQFFYQSIHNLVLQKGKDPVLHPTPILNSYFREYDRIHMRAQGSSLKY